MIFHSQEFRPNGLVPTIQRGLGLLPLMGTLRPYSAQIIPQIHRNLVPIKADDSSRINLQGSPSPSALVNIHFKYHPTDKDLFNAELDILFEGDKAGAFLYNHKTGEVTTFTPNEETFAEHQNFLDNTNGIVVGAVLGIPNVFDLDKAALGNAATLYFASEGQDSFAFEETIAKPLFDAYPNHKAVIGILAARR